MKIFSIFLFLFLNTLIYAQVKVGNNPNQIDASSILELESTDKVLVITKANNSQMLAIQPLVGALVYNTEEQCVFTFNGSIWVSLCDNSTSNGPNAVNVTTSSSAPVSNNLGDFWINDSTNNTVSIWDGNQWIPIDTNPRRGNGIPDDITAPNPLPGDIYVDQNTGSIYAYNGSIWINSSTSINANNGVLIAANNTIQLGGVLIKPTIVETNATNTLAITGLQDGDVIQDDIVTVNRASGALQKINPSNLLREEVAIITATNGQIQFNPPLNIADSQKVNVYRNGVRIDFTVVNNTTIELEPEAICYQGDQIRIVQFY